MSRWDKLLIAFAVIFLSFLVGAAYFGHKYDHSFEGCKHREIQGCAEAEDSTNCTRVAVELCAIKYPVSEGE